MENNIELQVIAAQGYRNLLAVGNNTVFVKVVSQIGLTKDISGAIIELPVSFEDGEDIVNFMINDLKTLEVHEDHFVTLMQLEMIPRADQMDTFIKIDQLPKAVFLMNKLFL